MKAVTGPLGGVPQIQRWEPGDSHLHRVAGGPGKRKGMVRP